jgi:hypothetical protein
LIDLHAAISRDYWIGLNCGYKNASYENYC